MISNLFLDIMFLHYIYVEIWYKLLNTIFKIFEQYLTYNLVYRILGYGRVKKNIYILGYGIKGRQGGPDTYS